MSAALCAMFLSLVPTGGDELASKVTELVRAWETEKSPGAALAIVRRGEPLLVRCFGAADLAAARPITPQTPFYIASLAKPFTAALAMKAASSGKLDLDAAVTKLFPELPSTYGAATVRHLLHHRSGIPDVYDTAVAADLGIAPVRSNAAAIELLARLPQLSFVPGTDMLYSNSGYVLLAEAIARSTGRNFATYAHDELFGPLRMTQACFVGDAKASGAAKSYARDDAGWTEQSIRTGLQGPGGLLLSLDDLVRWECAWARGEWGTAELRAALLTAPAGRNNPRFGPYAAGWMLQDFEGLRVQAHMGGAFGYSADLQRFPDQGVSVIALSNSSEVPAHELATALARIVLADALAAAKPKALASVELSPEARLRFGRIWRNARTGAVWVVTPKPDHFVVATLGDLKLELVAVGEKRLEARNSHERFAVEASDDGLTVTYADGSSERLVPVPFPPRNLPPVGSYAGAYENAALKARIELEVRDGQLALVQHDPLLEIPPFIALAPDLFVCDKGARLDFGRDRDGHVKSLEFSANRAWGLHFERRAD